MWEPCLLPPELHGETDSTKAHSNTSGDVGEVASPGGAEKETLPKHQPDVGAGCPT
jgi:hypothetical protein